jgi:ribosome-associated translation inhibitor RaiA
MLGRRMRSRDVKRSAFPAETRRSRKLDARRPPASIRTSGVRLSREERSYIRRKVGLRLGKFSPAIERVTVRVSDANGPRGGVDKICAAKVVVSGLPSVVVERKEHDVRAAIDGTLTAAERAVRKVIQRRRRARPRAAAARPRTRPNRNRR